MSSTTDFNLVFNALDRVDRRWAALGERRVFKTGACLFAALTDASGLLFPTDGLVSLLVQSAAGPTPQVGMVGRLGVVGAETLISGRSALSAVVDVEVAGTWVAMAPARRIVETCARSRAILERYLEHERAEIARWAANASALSVGERLAAWIEEASTSLGSDVVPVSHSLIAERLGIRRASISEDLAVREKQGIIAKGIKRIDVRDGHLLFEAAKGPMSVGTANMMRLMMDLGQIAA